MSNVGAAGIWQIMPDTASGLGVHQDWWYDGRRDVIMSTRAALSYLDICTAFLMVIGYWQLPHTIQVKVMFYAAIRRNISDGRDTDFWSLPVAQQTKDYVPSLLALAVIISNPDQYPIYFPPVRNAAISRASRHRVANKFKSASKLWRELMYKKLIQLNPGFNRPSKSTKGSSKVILPIENVEQFTENLARSPLNTQLRWMHYKVKSGDTFASIAKKFNTSTTALRKMNHLAKNTMRYGTNLLIPTNGSINKDMSDTTFDIATDETPKVKPSRPTNVTTLAQNDTAYSETNSQVNLDSAAKTYTLQPGDTIYMVRKNDTLDSIAKRFHIDRTIISTANNLNMSKVTPGKHLLIPTHPELIASAASAYTVPEKRVQPGDTIYMVRKGDTVDKIAYKFHTSAAAVRLANLIDDSSLMEGERVEVVLTDLPS